MKKIILIAFVFLVLVSKYDIQAENNSEKTSINLEYVLEEGLKNNEELNILSYYYELWNYQLNDLNDQLLALDHVESITGGYLSTSYEELLNSVPNYSELTEEEKTQIDEMINTQILINQTINFVMDNNAQTQNIAQEEQIAEQRITIEDSIYQLQINKEKNQLQREEMKIGLELMLTTQYANLLIYQDQIKLLEIELDNIESEIRKNKIFFKYGLIAKEELYNLEFEKKIKERELEKYDLLYQSELTKLLLQLGLPLDLDIYIEPITIEKELLNEIDKPSDISYLINNSYNLKLAIKDLEWYEYLEENNNLNNINIKKQQEYNVKIANEEVLQLKNDLKTKIDELYRIADEYYIDYQNANENYKDALSEYRKKEKEYSLGVISKYEFNKYIDNKKVARINKDIAELNYYMTREQINAMEHGYIR